MADDIENVGIPREPGRGELERQMELNRRLSDRIVELKLNGRSPTIHDMVRRELRDSDAKSLRLAQENWDLTRALANVRADRAGLAADVQRLRDRLEEEKAKSYWAKKLYVFRRRRKVEPKDGE